MLGLVFRTSTYIYISMAPDIETTFTGAGAGGLIWCGMVCCLWNSQKWCNAYQTNFFLFSTKGKMETQTWTQYILALNMIQIETLVFYDFTCFLLLHILLPLSFSLSHSYTASSWSSFVHAQPSHHHLLPSSYSIPHEKHAMRCNNKRKRERESRMVHKTKSKSNPFFLPWLCIITSNICISRLKLSFWYIYWIKADSGKGKRIPFGILCFTSLCILLHVSLQL